jgi:hypothetical protein
MKKLLSMVMVMILVLSLCVTAFAVEDTGSITIVNATVGETYKIYKLFDASYDDDAVSYTIVTENNPLFVELFGADGTKDNSYFFYNASSNVVQKKADINDAELV